MFRIFYIYFLCFSLSVFADNAQKVAVIVPIENEALTKIVAGIKDSVGSKRVIVKNAHGDQNMQFSIIKQLNSNKDVAVVMPIGTGASQMTIANIKNKPIVCVAADVKTDQKNVTGVNDDSRLDFILNNLPRIDNISIIYSASEKIASDVDDVVEYATKKNIKLHRAMINTIVDLPSAVKSAPKDTKAFLILKDLLVTSGIEVIVNEAKKRNIPVIAMDEGSVIRGATIAIGVSEREIGFVSGTIADKILKGESVSSLPYQTIGSLVLFKNEKAFNAQKIITKHQLDLMDLDEFLY